MVVAMRCFVFVACDNTVPNSGNPGVPSGLTDVERMEALRQSQGSRAQEEGMRTALRERQQGAQISAVNLGWYSSNPSCNCSYPFQRQLKTTDASRLPRDISVD